MKKLSSIAMYTHRFLDPTMTFIYRQLAHLEKEYAPVIYTSKSIHADLFPVDEILPATKNLFEQIRYVSKFHLLRSIEPVTRKQMQVWEKDAKSRQIQLIHAHFGTSGIAILPLAKKLNVPLLVSFYGIDASSHYLEKRRYRSQLANLLEYAHVHVVAKDMQKSLEEFVDIDPSRAHLNYFGIPLGNFSYVKREPIRSKVINQKRLKFLQISRLEEKKGILITLEAFSRLLAIYPQCQFDIIGSGRMENIIKTRIQELNLSNHVTLIPRIPPEDVITYLNQADVFLHHSVTSSSGDKEGLPNVIIEAMSTGLPVVSTFHAGIPEIIEDNVNGFLIHERAVDAYAQKLFDLLELGEGIGEKASQSVQSKFSLQERNKELINIYKMMINDKSRASK